MSLKPARATLTSTSEPPVPLDIFIHESLANLARPAWVSEVVCPLRWIPQPVAPIRDGYGVWLDHGGAALLLPNGPEPLHLPVPEIAVREKGGNLLLRACTPRGRSNLRLLDACAGFGLDGLILAQRHEVTMVDRAPIVHVLQTELCARAGEKVAHLLGVAEQHMHEDAWDVIYLDPMFPARSKTALPKLAMQHLRALAQTTSPAGLDALLEQARETAIERVVLKRRAKDPVAGKPSFSLRGRTVRFDVYQS